MVAFDAIDLCINMITDRADKKYIPYVSSCPPL